MRVKHISGWEAEVVRNTSDTTFVKADDPRMSGEYASSVFIDLEEDDDRKENDEWEQSSSSQGFSPGLS